MLNGANNFNNNNIRTGRKKQNDGPENKMQSRKWRDK